MAFQAGPVLDWANPSNKPSAFAGLTAADLNLSSTPVVYNSSPLFVRAPAPDTVAASGGGTVGYPIV